MLCLNFKISKIKTVERTEFTIEELTGQDWREKSGKLEDQSRKANISPTGGPK